MSRTANLELWKSATDLTEAWYVFATVEERITFENIGGFNDSIAQAGEQASIMGMMKVVSAAWAAKGSRDAQIDKMKEALLDALYASDMLALGIRQRPSKSHYPVSIDPDYFQDGIIVSNGAQTGPPIGVEEGPPFRDGWDSCQGRPALGAPPAGLRPAGGAPSASRF